MSLSIGQASGYINKIENRQHSPSMNGFFYICEYFGITPQEFFDGSREDPRRLNGLTEKLSALSGDQLRAIEALLDAFRNP